MLDFRHLAPRFRASKTRNGLIFVALPLGNETWHWTRCRLVRLHEAPNRASATIEAPQNELSCTPIPPTQFVGYILSCLATLFTTVRLPSIGKRNPYDLSTVTIGINVDQFSSGKGD